MAMASISNTTSAIIIGSIMVGGVKHVNTLCYRLPQLTCCGGSEKSATVYFLPEVRYRTGERNLWKRTGSGTSSRTGVYTEWRKGQDVSSSSGCVVGSQGTFTPKEVVVDGPVSDC